MFSAIQEHKLISEPADSDRQFTRVIFRAKQIRDDLRSYGVDCGPLTNDLEHALHKHEDKVNDLKLQAVPASLHLDPNVSLNGHPTQPTQVRTPNGFILLPPRENQADQLRHIEQQPAKRVASYTASCPSTVQDTTSKDKFNEKRNLTSLDKSNVTSSRPMLQSSKQGLDSPYRKSPSFQPSPSPESMAGIRQTSGADKECSMAALAAPVIVSQPKIPQNGCNSRTSSSFVFRNTKASEMIIGRDGERTRQTNEMFQYVKIACQNLPENASPILVRVDFKHTISSDQKLAVEAVAEKKLITKGPQAFWMTDSGILDKMDRYFKGFLADEEKRLENALSCLEPAVPPSPTYEPPPPILQSPSPIAQPRSSVLPSRQEDSREDTEHKSITMKYPKEVKFDLTNRKVGDYWVPEQGRYRDSSREQTNGRLVQYAESEEEKKNIAGGFGCSSPSPGP